MSSLGVISVAKIARQCCYSISWYSNSKHYWAALKFSLTSLVRTTMLQSGDALILKTRASIISCDVILSIQFSERQQNNSFLYHGTVTSIKDCWIKLKDSYIKKPKQLFLPLMNYLIHLKSGTFSAFPWGMMDAGTKKRLTARRRFRFTFLAASCHSRRTFLVERRLWGLLHALVCCQRYCGARKFPLHVTKGRYTAFCGCFRS